MQGKHKLPDGEEAAVGDRSTKDHKLNRNPSESEKISANLALVGGGRDCKALLEFIRKRAPGFLDIRVVGVCDKDPDAEGVRMAEDMGIYVTRSLEDLLRIEGLDAVAEMTSQSGKVMQDILRLKPERVGVVDYNVGRLVRGLFRIEQMLQSAEERVEVERMAKDFLIQQTNERIVVLDPDFTIVEVNEPYLKAVNKVKSEVIGARCYEVTHGLDQPCSSSQPDLGCPLTETLSTGQSAHVIHEHPSTDGKSTFCDMVTYPLKAQNGEILRIIEVWRDITHDLSLRWERRIRALKADLKKLVQEDRMISLGKLVASSVHEINNPIQGLMTFSQLMQDMLKSGEPEPEELAKCNHFLAIMSKELERCGNIISGLLSFSRQSAMEYSDVDLNEILSAVITLTRHKLELQNIQTKENLCRGPLFVHGDINQLQQCFLNLVFNAIEAMPDGGNLEILSRYDEGGRNAVVEVSDTGYGIHAENLEHIFDPFFTTKEEGKGTGLGLSIVHGIIKSHGGNIKVNSEAGKGSSFLLHIPSRKSGK